MEICVKEPYIGMRVYGPYIRKDGRKHVILVDAPPGIVGNKITISYPKYLMELMLGRKLDPIEETIDHIDHDFTNNSFSNLRIIPLKKHLFEDSRRVVIQDKMKCVFCGKDVSKSRVKSRHRNISRNKAGPFCSNTCSGKYGAELQNGRMLELESNVPNSFYTRIKKEI